jgi:hypothetical protein
MRSERGWLQAQMKSAKQEISNWHGWKQDTIRKEISSRLSTETRGESSVIRSASTGRLVVKERKK